MPTEYEVGTTKEKEKRTDKNEKTSSCSNSACGGFIGLFIYNRP